MLFRGSRTLKGHYRFFGRLTDLLGCLFFEGDTSFAVKATFMIVFIPASLETNPKTPRDDLLEHLDLQRSDAARLILAQAPFPSAAIALRAGHGQARRDSRSAPSGKTPFQL
jgi:hypothetical protein